MTAYYNEIDGAAAQWLRNLIEAGHIAPGYVDERSIEDVYPSDLRGFTQCHFFAGIGVWSYALRQAGFPDDRPVWSGSCPCQPFSAAGKGAAFDDERHLWPAFNHLISQCKPELVIGEQVASKDADAWIDLVQADLEAVGYAFGAIPFPSASVGAPHIRDRLYWVADTSMQQPKQLAWERARPDEAERRWASSQLAGRGDAGGVEHAGSNHDAGEVSAAGSWQSKADRPADQPRGSSISSGGVADHQLQIRPDAHPGSSDVDAAGGRIESSAALAGLRRDLRPGPVNGFWRDADWLLCRDGKWRPVEPGTFPLVNGASARVVRLRAYGNAVNAKAAQTFIECVMGATQ